MTFGADFLDLAVRIALMLLGASFVLTAVRIIRGPTLPDRILALDMLVAIGIGFIAVIAVKTRVGLYIDVAISLGLVGFLSTVAFARYVLRRGASGENAASPEVRREGKRQASSGGR